MTGIPTAKPSFVAIIAKAKKGELEAVEFLLEHSNFKFPDFKVNGNEESLGD